MGRLALEYDDEGHPRVVSVDTGEVIEGVTSAEVSHTGDSQFFPVVTLRFAPLAVDIGEWAKVDVYVDD